MKFKMTAMIIGTMLAISNTIPAIATVSNNKAKDSTITKVSSHKNKPHVDNSRTNNHKVTSSKPSHANSKVKKSSNTKVSSQKTRYCLDSNGIMRPTLVQPPNANGQVNNCPVTKVSSQKSKWRLDNSSAIVQTLTSVEQENFNKFQNAIKQGLSAKEASDKIADAKYTKLKGTDNQYQISLSPKARATFVVNEKDHVVQILQVGYYT